MAKLTCPKCKCITNLGIPKNKCLSFFKCFKCDKIIKAQKNCCVFCEYSKEKCSVSSIKVQKSFNTKR